MANKMEARYMLEGKLEAIETLEEKMERLEESKYKPEEEETLTDWEKNENSKIQRKIEGLKLVIELLLK